MNDELLRLRFAAREIFREALAQMEAGRAVKSAVRLEGDRLTIVGTEINLKAHGGATYCVAVGKAAPAMASALDAILGERLTGGVISATAETLPRLKRWRAFAGGHPLPNNASLDAARAAFELLREADERAAVVLFLVSGGGSAMLEWPREEATTLDELREMNRVLVSCGATIAEVNAVRRAVSAIKGGGLAARAPRAAQFTLIVSDTAEGEAFNVASGPTLATPHGTPDAAEVVARYGLNSRLPASILRAINKTHRQAQNEAREQLSEGEAREAVIRQHDVLLDNGRAIRSAAEAARALGFRVELASDIVEQEVEEGARALVSRLFEMRRDADDEMGGVCLISGGEFSCRVRGEGTGGRNAETALRCAFELDRRAGEGARVNAVALCAGTDGIDGNSPAAGALADQTTLSRARACQLDAQKSLDTSDAYNFFNALGDAIVTGPTGTNVRDLRILLAKGQRPETGV